MLDLWSRALDSCLDFEPEWNPGGKKRFSWEVLSSVSSCFLFVLAFLVVCFVFVKGNSFFLRTKNRVFKVDGWNMTTINFVSLVAGSHARIGFSSLGHPSYLKTYHKVVNSGSQGNGKTTLKHLHPTQGMAVELVLPLSSSCVY